MIIYQLQIVNFKSYNGEHTLGPFDQHFNCVIGPNGNGKSNIIDAVLFVFGFKSAKLRQDSLASLIHRSAFAQPQKASVSVVFQENGQLLRVSRSVTKSGNTYYKLNDEKINWSDLRQMLLRKKIDLNKNLFIILQGEVQRLCELAPDTMVEYLQYVSGSDELKEPIQAAQRIYIELSVKRQEAKMNLNVKKKIFANIEQKVREITVKILIRLRVHMLQHLVVKKLLLDNDLKLGKLKEQEATKMKAIEEIEAQIEQIQLKISDKLKELAPIECKIDLHEKEISSLESKRQKNDLMGKQVQTEITFLSKDRQKKNQQKDRYLEQQNQLRYIVQRQKQFIQRLKLIKMQISTEQHLSKLQSCLELQSKLATLNEEQQALINKNNEDNTNLSINRQKLQLFNRKYKENKQLKQSLKNKAKVLLLEKKEIEVKLAQTTDVIEQLERTVKVKSNEKLITVSNHQKIINQIRSANKAKVLCPETSLVTLRELVVISPPYREVIETILPQLDYFVVDTISQAKTISQYLKKKQIGRMSFLIKDLINQSAKEVKVASASPVNTKLVIDLIKSNNNDARNILIWAVGNTVIANDLETAMKVAYYDQKKFRAITPKGQFIDSSGTMTKLALKSIANGDDHQFIHQKIQTLKRVRSNLEDKKLQIQKQQGEITQTCQKIVAEQRSFDGLDEVILDELQKEVLKDRRIISNNRIILKELTDDLQKFKDELYLAKFDMTLYQKRLSTLKQIAQNEQKIKKVQNCDNIILNLQQKTKKTAKEIEDITFCMEQKIKVKIAYETEQEKLRKEIQEKQYMIKSIVAGKVAIETEVASLEEERGFRQSKLGENNRNNNNEKLRAELNRLRASIRAMDFEQIELGSKLQMSLDNLKDQCWSIYKNIYNNYPELVPLQQKQAQSGRQSDTLSYLLQSQAPLQIGKHQFSFLALLTLQERQYLLSTSKKKFTFYKETLSLFPNSSNEGLVFEAIETKDVKLSHTYEIEKLKHQEREGTFEEEEYLINLELFSQYKETKEEFEGLDKKVKEIQTEVTSKKNELIELRNRRLTIFMDNFNQINIELNRIYNQLTGGKAELNFLDSINPFQGVQFSVRPVNKSWKRVNLLSGGQKTFTSLALIFACEQIKSFPFYFMDEIDAALDYKNTTLLAHFIKQKTHTQHIVISLRKNMYQECNRLIGIYKVNDQSRTLEVPMHELTSKHQ